MIDEKELAMTLVCPSCGYPQDHDVPVILFHKRSLQDKETGEITTNSLRCNHCSKWLIEFRLQPKNYDGDELED
jgi:hypothetical protein